MAQWTRKAKSMEGTVCSRRRTKSPPGAWATMPESATFSAPDGAPEPAAGSKRQWKGSRWSRRQPARRSRTGRSARTPRPGVDVGAAADAHVVPHPDGRPTSSSTSEPLKVWPQDCRTGGAVPESGRPLLLIEQKLTIAMQISDRCLVMGPRHRCFDGTPDSLRADAGVRKEWLESERRLAGTFD